MKVSRVTRATISMLALFTVLAIPNLAASQAPTSLTAVARGDGTLTMGKEVFKVSTVVVKLKEDGTGEITVVTEFQLFLTCTWSAPADLSKGIDLKITGGTNPGTAEGSGKLFLKADGKSIASLSMQGMSTASKRKVQLNFVAE